MHRGGRDVEADLVGDLPVEPDRAAIGAVAGLVVGHVVEVTADDARNLTGGCERVVRVERAIGRGAARDGGNAVDQRGRNAGFGRQRAGRSGTSRQCVGGTEACGRAAG